MEITEYHIDKGAKKVAERRESGSGFYFSILPKILVGLAVASLLAGIGFALAAYLTPDEYYIRYYTFGLEEKPHSVAMPLIVGAIMCPTFLACAWRQRTVRTALRTRERLYSTGRFLWYSWHVQGDLSYVPGYVPTDVHPTSLQVIAVDLAQAACSKTDDGLFWRLEGGIRWKRCLTAEEATGLRYEDMDPVASYDIGDYFAVDLTALVSEVRARSGKGEL